MEEAKNEGIITEKENTGEKTAKPKGRIAWNCKRMNE